MAVKQIMWTVLCYFCMVISGGAQAQYTPAILQIVPGPQPQTVCITAPFSGLVNTCVPIGTLNSATGVFIPVNSGSPTFNLTGYIYGNGSNPATASPTIPAGSVQGLNGNAILQDTNTWTSQNTFSVSPVISLLSGPLIGNGVSPLTAGTILGNTTKFAVVSGSFTSGDCPKFDASFNLVDNGSPCGTSSGTVGSGLINQLAYYAASGTNLTGLTTANNGTLITSSGGAPSISSTLPAAVQGNITTIGTLTAGSIPASLLTGTLPSGVQSNITMLGNLTVGNIPGGLLTGTIASGVQSNITTVGTLTAGNIPGSLLTGSVAASLLTGTTPSTLLLGSPQFTTTQGLSIGITGLDATGATDMASIIQSALTAVAGGGVLQFPCGTFKLLSSVSVTITGRVEIVGSGNCTIFSNQGGSTQGLTVTWGNGSASKLALRRFHWQTTDTTGVYTGITFVNHFQPGWAAPDVTQGNVIQDVWIEGADHTGSNTQYWGTALFETGVSTVDYYNLNITGASASGLGIGVKLQGYAAGPVYSVVHNFHGSNFYRLSNAFFYGDYLQGVTFNATNFTQCSTYCIDTVTSPAGFISELYVTAGSQFGFATLANIRLNTTAIFDVKVSDTLLAVAANAENLRINGGQRVTLKNNDIFCNSTTGSVGIHFAGTVEGSMSGNEVGTGTSGGCGTGVKIDNIVAALKIDDSNNIQGSTTDYVVNASAIGPIIFDDVGRAVVNLPTCNSSIQGSIFRVVDQNTTIAYNGAVTGGGTNYQRVACNGAWLQR